MAHTRLNTEVFPLMLAGDTSTGYCTVALCQCDKNKPSCIPISTMGLDSRHLHSERLLEAVEGVLEKAGTELQSLSCLAMTTGPGSFTGLRVGLSFWKGLALALQLPLVSVPTLDALARMNAFPQGTLVPLLDARMKEVFGAVYRFQNGCREKIVPDQAASVDFFIETALSAPAPLVFLGDGAQRYENEIRSRAPEAMIAEVHCGLPRADAVAAEALDLWLTQTEHNPADAVPLYHRLSQAEQAKEAAGAKAAAPEKQQP